MIVSSELIEGAPFLIRAGARISELAKESNNIILWPVSDERFPLCYTEDMWFRFVVVTLETGVSLANAAMEIVQNGFTPTHLEHLTVLSRDRPALQHMHPIFATGRIVENSFPNGAFPMIDGWGGGRIELLQTSLIVQQAHRILCIHSS